MISGQQKILAAGLWLLLLISQPLLAGLAAEHLLSINAGLDQPTDTAVGNNGDIYILNGVLSQVVVFSKNGKLIRSFGQARQRELRIRSADGNKYQR